MPEQITKKQHFAPSFYFKRFSDDGWLQTLDIKNGRVMKHQPYRGVCYADYFYSLETGEADEVSQQFEEFFKSIEDVFALDFDKLINDITSYHQLSEEQLDKLAVFMSCLWIRSPQMRTRLNRMMEDGLKQVMEHTASHPSFIEQTKRGLEEEGIEATEEMVQNAQKTFLGGDYDINFDNQNHLQFISESENFFRWFRAKNFRFYIANGSKKFITSDTPVVEIFNEGKTMIEQMYSNHIMQRRHFLALTPKILIELTNPLVGKKVKRKALGNNDVVQYNLMRARYSDKFCYGINKDDLDDLLPYYHGTPLIPRRQ